MEQFYTQNLAPALTVLGATVENLTQTYTPDARTRWQTFSAAVAAGEFPAFSGCLQAVPASLADVPAWAKQFSHIAVLGMGGSSLAGKLISHFQDPAQLHPPHLLFVDTLDPTYLDQLCHHLPLATTGVVAVSKSGTTLETLTQLLLFTQALQAHGLPLPQHVRVITTLNHNALHQFALAQGLTALPHHPDVGGRFSAMIETALLPALCKGLDVPSYLEGMRTVAAAAQQSGVNSAPAQGAALHVLAQRQGFDIHVVYPYSAKFSLLGNWWEQLWAESIGKEGKGTTPLVAVGPGSQHSIQQQFLAGARDKLFTLILPHQTQHGTPIRPATAALLPGLAVSGQQLPLQNLQAGTLMQAMGMGTSAALQERGRPVREFILPQQSAATLGALLMHAMLETVFAACLWGVNPFDQPDVELSKQRSLAALGAL